MSIRITALIVLAIFSGFTIYAMANSEQSLINFGYQLLSHLDTAQVLADLYIMAFLAIVWMYRDTKATGRTVKYWLPFAALTLVFVSIGPLLYLALRPLTSEAQHSP